MPTKEKDREVIDFEGSFDDFRKEQKHHNETEKRVRYENVRSTSFAAADAVSLIPDSFVEWSKLNGEAGPVPLWIAKVHPSHRRLKFGAGLVACTKCGALSSSGSGHSNLWKSCSNKVADGSRGRLAKVLSGCHPHFAIGSDRCWPDGRPVGSCVRMKSYYRAIDTPASSPVLQSQRFYNFVFHPKEPTERQQLVVNGIMEHQLACFREDADHVLEFAGSLTAAMEVQVAHVATSKWFASSVWEEAVDQLLERSFHFEMACSLQLEEVIKRLELQHDANFDG